MVPELRLPAPAGWLARLTVDQDSPAKATHDTSCGQAEALCLGEQNRELLWLECPHQNAW
jgi:hypothetical protein